MRPNRRDIFGDGHGFVAASQGGPRASRRTVEIKTEQYRFNYDVTKLPRHKKPFLGLYDINGQKEVHIIWRADKPQRTKKGMLHFLTWEASEHPHFLEDPIAWAEMPTW